MKLLGKSKVIENEAKPEITYSLVRLTIRSESCSRNCPYFQNGT
jgi:hypothetical protein